MSSQSPAIIVLLQTLRQVYCLQKITLQAFIQLRVQSFYHRAFFLTNIIIFYSLLLYKDGLTLQMKIWLFDKEASDPYPDPYSHLNQDLRITSPLIPIRKRQFESP